MIIMVMMILVMIKIIQFSIRQMIMFHDSWSAFIIDTNVQLTQSNLSIQVVMKFC